MRKAAHGTESAYRRHRRYGEEACPECKAAAANAVRERAHARGARRISYKPAKPCGTYAAYMRHRRKNEPICALCREANRIYRVKLKEQ